MQSFAGTLCCQKLFYNIPSCLPKYPTDWTKFKGLRTELTLQAVKALKLCMPTEVVGWQPGSCGGGGQAHGSTIQTHHVDTNLMGKTL